MDNGHVVKYPYTEWGLHIKARLNGIERTQKWLSDTLGITAAYLSDMLKGKIKPSERWKGEVERLISEAEQQSKPA